MYLNQPKKYLLLYTILAVFFVALYFQYLKLDPVLKRDDLSLLTPFQKIGSFAQYYEAVKDNTILDVQPVRDLTFFVNVKFLYLTGLSTFHLTNLTIFFISIVLLSRLMQILNFSPQAIYITILLYALHPLMVSAVGWISARKHSLALVFLLMALIRFLKNKNIDFGVILFFYFLLCPIRSSSFFHYGYSLTLKLRRSNQIQESFKYSLSFQALSYSLGLIRPLSCPWEM
jgi:hypothetical protein